jgi:phospholipid/cholesterol/gamma-HCH transport system permease protein
LLEIIHHPAGKVEIRLTGDWTLRGAAADWQHLQQELTRAEQTLVEIGFDSTGITAWDSRLLTFLLKLHDFAQGHNIRISPDGLPPGVRGLLHLALAVPERAEARKPEQDRPFLYQLGVWTLNGLTEGRIFTQFVGEWLIAVGKLLRGRASFRRSDFIHFLQAAGYDALPIVSLISLLVGSVLAFVGAVQLQMFGAEVYIANLVALGMLREMGAMMTAIIMAGRTGSAYAAQLGTMQVNEEIDALKTLGISPMEFLVLPRSLALLLMLPLLCLWSDVLGIFGGFIVGTTLLDISLLEYLVQTRDSVGIVDLSIGLIKSVIFAGVISLAGCLRGLQSGRNSSAVGQATTSAMVTAILLIVIWDALTTLIFNRLGY